LRLLAETGHPAINRRKPGHAAALGFRAHTGWAAAVAVTLDGRAIERRRIAYEPAPTRFIYHHAAELSSQAAADTLIAAARAEATEKAREEIAKLIGTVRDNGITVVAAGVPGGNTRLPGTLGEILAAHSRIHAAEGAFYRDVLAESCVLADLPVRRTPERDLWMLASTAVSCSEDKLRERLVAMGRQIGPPWGEDQKIATLAALIALN